MLSANAAIDQDQDLITAERFIKALLQYMTYDEVISFLDGIGRGK